MRVSVESRHPLEVSSNRKSARTMGSGATGSARTAARARSGAQPSSTACASRQSNSGSTASSALIAWQHGVARRTESTPPRVRSLCGDDRYLRTAAPRPAHLGHRPLQLPLRLLHAEGGLRSRLPFHGSQGAPQLRGDRAGGACVRPPRRGEDPHHRRRAAAASRPRAPRRAPGRHRRPRPDADDERRDPPRQGRGARPRRAWEG